MIKHKRILKHKKPVYIPPWERPVDASDDNGGWRKYDPDSYESRHYRAHVQPGAFTLMVYWSIKGKFNLEETIHSYWENSTDEEFPEEGGDAHALLRSILKNLIIRGHRKNHIKLEDGEECVFPTMWNEIWDNLKTIHINKETKMAKKFKDPAEIDGPKKAKPQPQAEGGPRMTLKRQATIRCFEMLLEEIHTDEEIIDTIMDELEYKFIPSMIKRRRKMLNEGEAEEFGFETPDAPVEEIGGDEEQAIVQPKKSPLKPMKKKSTKAEPPLNKSLSVKKFKTKKFVLKKKA